MFHRISECEVSLSARCKKPNLFNYRFIPDGLWLEGTDTELDLKIISTVKKWVEVDSN